MYFWGIALMADGNGPKQKYFAEPVLKAAGHHDTVRRLLPLINLLALPPPIKAAEDQH